MNIEIIEHDEIVDINCRGFIEGLEDSLKIKREFQKAVMLNSKKKVNIYFYDSFTLPSSVIGTILELKEIEHIDISIKVEKKELFETLRRLTLVEILNIQKL